MKKEKKHRHKEKAVFPEDVKETRSEEQVEKAKEKEENFLEHLQRLQAEFDNFRKRTVKEKQWLRSGVLEEVFAGLLPVIDNFQRALDSSKETESMSSSFMQGVEMIYSQLMDILKGYGVVPIKALGEPFDPSVHEAVGSEESEQEENTIIREMQVGYCLKERVIRPSVVIIAKGIGENQETQPADEENECSSNEENIPQEIT